MLTLQRPPTVYPAVPRGNHAYGTVLLRPNPLDVKWSNTWPIVRSIILASIMILSSTAIIGLDIANVAIEGNKQNGAAALSLGPAKVGAGIWSGSISFLAAIFILVTVFPRNKRVAATFALIAVTLAFFFNTVLVGLVVNSIYLDRYPDYKQQYSIVTQMYAARPRIPVVRPIRPIVSARSTADVAWKLTWPFIITSIIAILMLLCIVVIGALEIASLAKGTSTIFYGNTASTGAGFWCGFFFAIAAGLILMINCMRRTRLWATIALIATLIAACFAVILLALDAKAVQDGNNFFPGNDKTKVLAAQLAFAIFEFLLCLFFIVLYIVVLIFAPRRIRVQQRPGFGNPYFG